ncbi:hypothetical protein ACEPAI_8255 [Sanghuangporus weigelae]
MQLSVATTRTAPSVRRLVKSVTDLIVAPASGALATIRYAVCSPVEEDVQRFGVILYILPIDGNGLVEITHVRMGVNGQNQVFRSRCDKDNKPVAMPVYLGPWDEYLSRMQASMATVHIQDMETCAEQLGTD